jgi:hypothetical protein
VFTAGVLLPLAQYGERALEVRAYKDDMLPLRTAIEVYPNRMF